MKLFFRKTPCSSGKVQSPLPSPELPLGQSPHALSFMQFPARVARLQGIGPCCISLHPPPRLHSRRGFALSLHPPQAGPGPALGPSGLEHVPSTSEAQKAESTHVLLPARAIDRRPQRAGGRRSGGTGPPRPCLGGGSGQGAGSSGAEYPPAEDMPPGNARRSEPRGQLER